MCTNNRTLHTRCPHTLTTITPCATVSLVAPGRHCHERSDAKPVVVDGVCVACGGSGGREGGKKVEGGGSEGGKVEEGGKEGGKVERGEGKKGRGRGDEWFLVGWVGVIGMALVK